MVQLKTFSRALAHRPAVRKSLFHIILFACALLMVLIFALFLLFYFYHPDPLTTVKAVLGGGISLAVFSAILRHLAIVNFSLVKFWISGIIASLDRHVLTASFISAILVAGLGAGLALMLSDFIDRYRYVIKIRQSVEALISEDAHLPNTTTLAEAYIAYPGRKEVPVLMVRASRVLSVGGSWSDFISFQRTYAEDLFNMFVSLPNSCHITGNDHDPVSYVVTTYVESSVTLKNGKLDWTNDFQDRLISAVELLSTCTSSGGSESIRKTIPRLIYTARIKSVLSEHNSDYAFDARDEINRIDDLLQKKTASELLWLHQSHSFQEFLDFKIKTVILSEKRIGCGYSSDTVEEVMADLRRLLSLRMIGSMEQEIRWSTPPQKMDTYRLFMAKGGFMAESGSSLLRAVNGDSKMAHAFDKIALSPAFRHFLQPGAWFKSTPIDLAIGGSSLRELFEEWLKKEW